MVSLCRYPCINCLLLVIRSTCKYNDAAVKLVTRNKDNMTEEVYIFDELEEMGETSVSRTSKSKVKQSPVIVTKFDNFFMSLRAVENEQREQRSDSLRRLRLGRYCDENTTRQSTIMVHKRGDLKEDFEIDDGEIIHIGDFEMINESGSHDVAQQTYGVTKEVWAWGKTVPLLSDVLGITEGLTSKVLALTINVDDLEKDLVIPNLKKFDEEIVSPSIGIILNVVGPAVSVGEEVIFKPAMHIVPHIPILGKLLGGNKED